MNKRITYFLSLAILIVFGLYAVPHEFVHVFYDHNDSEHCEHEKKEGPEISTIHIHCDFLCFYETKFVAPSEKHVFISTSVGYVIYCATSVTPVSCSLELRESRGPPTV